MDRCRSCKAPVFWAVHIKSGKRAPIDADPVLSGNVIVLSDGCYYVMHRGDPTPPATVDRYTSHYQTCPQAQAWRAQQARKAS